MKLSKLTKLFIATTRNMHIQHYSHKYIYTSRGFSKSLSPIKKVQLPNS